MVMSADARCEVCPVIIAEPLSAANSQYLERARMSRKLMIHTTSETTKTIIAAPAPLRSRLPPTPKNSIFRTRKKATVDRKLAIVITSRSLFLTWLSSWASTGSISGWLNLYFKEVITATTISSLNFSAALATALLFRRAFSFVIYIRHIFFGMFLWAKILPKTLRSSLLVNLHAAFFTIFVKPANFFTSNKILFQACCWSL